jgi:hypothetical protein
MPPRYGLFDFLAFGAIKTTGKVVLTFLGLTVIPLYLVFWLKRRNSPSPIIQLLNRCIRHGQSLTAEECGQINRYIEEMKSSLKDFAHQTSPSPASRVSLAQAIEALPLLYELSQSNTCGEHVPGAVGRQRKFDCKSSLIALLEELKQMPQLPVISEELAEIARVRQKMTASKRRRKLLTLLFMAAYSYASFLLSQTLLSARTSWVMELGVYLGCLLVFFLNYDYYYYKEFRRYQKGLKPKLRA